MGLGRPYEAQIEDSLLHRNGPFRPVASICAKDLSPDCLTNPSGIRERPGNAGDRGFGGGERGGDSLVHARPWLDPALRRQCGDGRFEFWVAAEFRRTNSMIGSGPSDSWHSLRGILQARTNPLESGSAATDELADLAVGPQASVPLSDSVPLLRSRNRGAVDSLRNPPEGSGPTGRADGGRFL